VSLRAKLILQSLRRSERVDELSGAKQHGTKTEPISFSTHQGASAHGLEPSSAILPERHDYQPLSSIDTDRYEYFFMDVFDTAIIRLFEKPIDVFRYIGQATHFANFERLRIYLENKMRGRNSARKDIKLAEIYLGFHGADLKRETDTEMTFCVAHPETLAFYADLVSKGKKIYFVSDMYLDRETIASILHKNGFDQYEDIFVSSEDDLIKGDGSRFAWLKTTLPDSVGKAIHIGDNHVSDWIQPRLQGYEAFQYLESIDFYRYDEFLFSKAPFLVAQQSLGVSFVLGMFRYWKSGFQPSKPGYWRQFGFVYGGALVAAFCGFINSTILNAKLSTSRVFFLARDGDIMSQVYRQLYPELDAVYLLASRRCMSFPSLCTMEPADDKDMLNLFTTPIGINCADDLIDRLGYDDLQPLKEALVDLESRGLLKSEPDVLACFVEHKDVVLAKAHVERDTLLHYLDSVNFFGDSDIVIADVGWGGTIQNALMKLLKHSGNGDQKLHGIYLGVSESVVHQDFKTGFLFQGDKSRFTGFLNLIELITSSPKDGVTRVAAVDGNYVPVCVKQSADELHRQSIAAEIQAGILEFAQVVKDKKIGNLDFFQSSDFEVLFESLQEHPSELDVEHLGQVKHAMTLGSHFGEKVLKKKV
jgi:predicted HAD superfamily hydrolase